MPVENICFGLNRKDDEQSLYAFLNRFSALPLLQAIIPRLSDHEIVSLVDNLTGLMQKHLSEKEYHSLFLADL
ncbi:MAG: hypothetical protein KKE17_01160 [Proteobacteria bacterium]|nr:hypothetical protein [Pseudomonadota bacterium]MBU1708591.1 hypothetical protein [Pseudomonadota bacterium]